MAESGGQEKARWITTVIMSSSFQGSDISMCLQNQQHRVRFSDTVEHGSIIFSLSGVAFLLADAQDLFFTDQELILLFDRTKKFMTIHRNGFLLLSAALHGPKEWDVMFRIQQRFLGSNLRILPVHNTAEAIKLMLIIAKTTSKPHLDSIRFRMAMAKTQIVEQSPVWKMLQSQLDCSVSSIN
ncbi:protein SPO16 homolog isoform X1 [Hemicordylus capensis]|uniref:protein SPO16 homolog isoform X1 n=1 Tax=Hemicordylus capensis TaxID=884348 RepID=UPI0023045F76|nr:protein SPO16 homolog isoform X1 [Hemicordylus capensis]XP_053099602.1 protein SPO16 homolog isoform X1 [Hemicordylus capensis]XP_053099603.1 protein SPO16 homolog isoform X1 [Hemicordylus capensis]